MTGHLIISAPQTGAGKTTLTAGMMRALTHGGEVVQGFKVGADYVDPISHTKATGRTGYNLDLWMMGEEPVRELFAKAATTADIAITEGVMGLFDGPPGGLGSTAHMARVLGSPVVLVLDASAAAQSLAAIALGFSRFDPGVRVAGVIANRVASDRHAELVAEGLHAIGIPLLGAIPNDDRLQAPNGSNALVAWIEQVAQVMERHMDWQSLLKVARSVPPITAPAEPTIYTESWYQKYSGLRLAIARDEAFNFYYGDLRDWLTYLGVDILEFSPLRDSQLPEESDGILFGGGRLDRYVKQLSANKPMLQSVRAAYADGMPIYGEAGGYQYLLQELTIGNDTFELAGCLAGGTVLEPTLQGIGYRTAHPANVADNNHWLPSDMQIRGHVFHFSRPVNTSDPAAWQLYHASGELERDDGALTKNCLAGYLQTHLPTQPALAQAFLERCAVGRDRRK